MAETWSGPPMPPHAPPLPTSTTLLVRRLPADDLARALSLLALAGDIVTVRRTGFSGAVYVLVDVGAASDDEPLAAALVGCPSPGHDVVLIALAVLPARRGRGLGGRLLAEVVDDLRAGGVLAVWAPIRVGEAGTAGDGICRRLLLRRGFRSSGAPQGRRPEPGTEWVRLEL